MVAPQDVERIRREARRLGFDAECHPETGQLLTVLAAAKPGGRLLELGTGAGLGTAHLLAGMDRDSRLTSVELDAALSGVAASVLGGDPRLQLVVADGEDWLRDATPGGYDLVFADTWPGKFSMLDAALSLVARGGLYVIDDLLPQANWPDGHQAAVDDLVARLSGLSGWQFVRLDVASGLMIGTRTA